MSASRGSSLQLEGQTLVSRRQDDGSKSKSPAIMAFFGPAGLALIGFGVCVVGYAAQRRILDAPLLDRGIGDRWDWSF